MITKLGDGSCTRKIFWYTRKDRSKYHTWDDGEWDDFTEAELDSLVKQPTIGFYSVRYTCQKCGLVLDCSGYGWM